MAEYTLGLPPAIRSDEVASLDIEVFGQGAAMHRPDGEMACVAVTTEKGTFLLEDEKDVTKLVTRLAKGKIAMHHAPYDLRYLRRWGIDIESLRVWDTELADRLRWGGYYQFFALDDLARRELDIELDKSVRKEFATAREMTPTRRRYAAKDAQVTRQIALRQMKHGLDAYYWKVEYPALMVVMNLGPIHIDQDKWTDLATSFEKTRRTLQEALGFNPGSHIQVKEEVETKLGIRLRNAQAETLQVHAQHPIIRDILEYKSVAKNASTYGEGWLEKHLWSDGCVYPSWRVTGAETGRMSCAAPNVQQIPVRKFPVYRECIIASPGNVIVSVDADQQEPRCLAYLSQDGALRAAIQSGVSTHLAVARELFGDPSIVKDDPRYAVGKTVNLGLSYGQSAVGLARELGVTKDEAQSYIETYFARFPGVASWMRAMQEMAWRMEIVPTAGKRYIHVNPYSDQRDRNAVNGPVQGTAAEITKLALALVRAKTAGVGLPFGVIMVVHDEIVFDVPRRDAKRYAKIADEAWKEAADQIIPGIPFASEAHIGPTWSKA